MSKSNQAFSSQYNYSSSDDGDEVCDICRSGDSCPEDVIIFCDSCSVPVHASCYTLKSIPTSDEPWFCYPCSKGFQTSKMACALCNHASGAFKRTSIDEGTWVHGLCANWIPELCEEADDKPEFGPLVRMDHLLKDRSRLKCSECTGKKGCVQCSHLRCLTAIHPHCMLKKDNDFSWRVIEGKLKGGQSYYRREVYCSRHIEDVGLPMKSSDELLIQVDPKSKYEWNEDYAPVLKAQYRNDPAYADLHRGTPQKARNSREGASSSSVCNSSRRSKEQPAPDASRTLTAEGHNIPMKRPRASILQSLVASGREMVPSSSSSGRGVGSGGVDQQRTGDKRAPSKPPSSLLSLSSMEHTSKSTTAARQATTARATSKPVCSAGASTNSGSETPVSVSSRSIDIHTESNASVFSSAYFNSNNNPLSSSSHNITNGSKTQSKSKKKATRALQPTAASDDPGTPPPRARTSKVAASPERIASSSKVTGEATSSGVGGESLVTELAQAQRSNKRKRGDDKSNDHSNVVVPTAESSASTSMLSFTLDAHTVAQLQRALLNLHTESSTSAPLTNNNSRCTSSTTNIEVNTALQTDLEKHRQLNQALCADRDALQQQNEALLASNQILQARVDKLEEQRLRRKARKLQRRQS